MIVKKSDFGAEGVTRALFQEVRFPSRGTHTHARTHAHERAHAHIHTSARTHTHGHKRARARARAEIRRRDCGLGLDPVHGVWVERAKERRG